MKKLFITSLITLAIGQTNGAFASEGQEKLYTGQAKGLIGNIRIEAGFGENKIVSVKVLEHSETPTVGGEALKKLAVSSIGREISEIDTVAGATNTSNGFRLALEEALNNKKIKHSNSL